MTVYSSQIATAKRLIQAKGRAVTLERDSSTYDPVTGSDTTTTTTYDTVAVLLPPDSSTLQAYAKQFQDGTLVLSKVQMAYMPQFDVDPEPGDRLSIGGVDWSVVGVETTAPDGTSIIHKVLVSK